MEHPAGGQPLELVRFNTSTSKFEVGQEALAILRTVKGPVGVVAVSGRARQGKSFILNQLLQVSAGFAVGPTTRPCTKGLWMWSAPQQCTARDGTDYHLVLLDTEGIDSYDQTAQYSTQIFSLAVLLSSLFVYNQMGGIDEAALDRLSLVTEMTRHIRVRASGRENDAADLRDFTPSFLWLLRDFYLRLEDEHGRVVTPNDYLETALLPVAGVGAAVEAKNQIRTSIKSLFPDRDCAVLVRPAHEEAALVSLDIEDSAIRPEFREGVQALLALIFRKAQPKRLGNFVLTGAVLAGLTEAYVEAINNGAVPTIATAWQGVAEQECRRAADAALSKYAEVFDEGVAPEEKALDDEHNRALKAAQEAFADVAVGEERIQKAHLLKFVEAANARYSQVRGRKLAEASNAVNEMLLQASSAINSSMALEGIGAADFQSHLTRFLEAYMQLPNSPTKWTKLIDFLKHTYPAVVTELISRKEAAARHDVARLEQELAEATRQAGNQRDRAEQAEAQLAECSSRAELLDGQVTEQRTQLAHAKVEGEQQRGKVSALEAQLREVQLVAEKKLACSYAEAEARARAAALEHEQAVSRLQGQLSEERMRCGELSTELAEASGRIHGLEAQLAAAAGEGSGWAARYSEAKSEQAALARHLDRLEAQLAALQREKALVERERDRAQADAACLQAQLSDFDVALEGHMEEAEREKDRSLAASRSVSRKPSGQGEDLYTILQHTLALAQE